MATKTSSDDREKLLIELTDAFGPSGFEEEVGQIVEKHLGGFCEIMRDGLGSTVGKKVGAAKSPSILIAGHMDEVGFMVSGITKSGYIKVNPLGGWWPHVLPSQRVVIRTRSGKLVHGIIGSKAPHSLKAEERNKVMDLDDLYIDIGASEDNEAAKKFGVKVGDPIVPYAQFEKLGPDGKFLMAKAWDNRIGVAVAIEVAKALKNEKHPNTLFAGGTVQEEVGLRGAGTCAYFVDPDIAIAIDVTLAADIPGSPQAEWGEKIGKGPSISVMDGSLLPNPRLLDFVLDIADKNKIPYQMGSLGRGGTDGGRFAVTKQGIPSLTLSIATRYIHSHYGILHRDDVDNLVAILVETIKALDVKAYENIKP
ncbi:MAG TPA: M42 family peptidase [candidate division Zixibacteria bacterium]|nr:M42 family peptidase [candidate division Zixibacteria bacterium]